MQNIKLTYLEERVLKRMEKNTFMKVSSIGDPNTLRGTISSLIKKGLIIKDGRIFKKTALGLSIEGKY